MNNTTDTDYRKPLPGTTLVRFGIWNLIGLCIYFAYSRRHSLMARAG